MPINIQKQLTLIFGYKLLNEQISYYCSVLSSLIYDNKNVNILEIAAEETYKKKFYLFYKKLTDSQGEKNTSNI